MIADSDMASVRQRPHTVKAAYLRHDDAITVAAVVKPSPADRLTLIRSLSQYGGCVLCIHSDVSFA